MPHEDRPLLAPPAPRTPVESSSTLLLLAVILMVSGAGVCFFSGITFVSPLVLPLLLLIIGSLFVLKSYQGRTASRLITISDPSSQSAMPPLNHPVADSPSLSPSLSVNDRGKLSHATNTATAGTPSSSAIDFNIRTTVEETVLRFAHEAKGKGIELSCLFSSDNLAPCHGDPGELRLILLNLIDYALSSLTPREVVVREDLLAQTATHATFRFSVSSLQHASADLLFATATTAESNKTTSSSTLSREGAGLALCKQLVQNWGGQFGFEKDPNLGATVWFTITLAQPTSHEYAAPAPHVDLSGARILVVSDDFSLSEMDVRSWGATSHRLLSSASIYTTLTAAVQTEQPYDILLFHCPSLDNTILDLALRIRRTAILARLRLVLLTNWGRKGEARKVHDAGFDAYITNPASSTLLFECFTTLLGQSSQTHTSRAPLVTRYTLAEARMRGRTRILIVESNLSEQKHAARLVEELGYRAVIVTTAREAIESSTRLPYTAVLLPAQMPGIDGIAAAEQIRHVDRKEGKHTPLIGIITWESKREREQCLTAGMDTVIDRPIRAASLIEALRHCQTVASTDKNRPVVSQEEQRFPQLNFHDALARIEGEKEMFDEMAALFVEEYPKVLLKMREAISRQDTQVLVHNAHTLTGTLGNFAATQAITTTQQLEDMGRRGDLALASPTLTALERQLAQLQAQLADFQNQATA